MTPNISGQALTLPSTGVISCQSQICLSLPLPPIQQPVVLLVTCQCIGGSSIEVGASYQPQQTQQWAPVCTAARKRPGPWEDDEQMLGRRGVRGVVWINSPYCHGQAAFTVHSTDWTVQNTHTSQHCFKPIRYLVHRCACHSSG